MTTGIHVFSATKARDREVLGETVTAWLREHHAVGTRHEVRQSSDNEFHCVSITVWYEADDTTAPRRTRRNGGAA